MRKAWRTPREPPKDRSTSAPVELIVFSAPNDEAGPWLGDAAGARNRAVARPEGYIDIAARTLGRCEPGTFILPEILGEAGLVII